MKFFQQRWVAVTLCALMIISAFGIAKRKEDRYSRLPSDTAAVQQWKDENYESYTGYVWDQAELFSDRTVRKIAEYNAGFDYVYGSIWAVATVSDAELKNMKPTASDTAAAMGLGDNDYLLLIDVDTEKWCIVYGESAAQYVDRPVDAMVAEHMTGVFRETDDSLLNLFEELEHWYADTVPLLDHTGTVDHAVKVIGGSVLFFLLFAFLVVAALLSAALRFGRRIYFRWSRRRSGDGF